MIIRKNLDWLSFSIVNIPTSYSDIFEKLIYYYNLEKQDYKIRNCYVAFNDYMNVFCHTSLEYLNIELKPLFFWRYLNKLITDEEYYIDYIVMMFSTIGYKVLRNCIKFNRVDLAIDYIGEFVSFEKSFQFISQKKIKSLETIRNVGEFKNGFSSYLNGSNWNICRYEKSKEIMQSDKSYYPDVYRNNNIIRLEIRLKKDYLKNYDNNRHKFFYLIKKLIEQIDDTEMNKLNLLDNIDKVKTIRTNARGEFMILKEKIINDILNNLELLHALENVYYGKDNLVKDLISQIEKRYNPKNLKEKERRYRYYLKSS